MIALRFNDLAQLLNVETTATNPVLESIVTDSRQARQGSLFAALPGERVDGHDFATKTTIGYIRPSRKDDSRPSIKHKPDLLTFF